MILQLLFALVSAASYVVAQQPCLNAPQNPHSFAASPLSCAHYTICMGGNTIVGPEQQCTFPLLFDPPTQSCGQTSCLECSPFGVQNLPYPDNCYQYVECIMGHRQILTCPNGLLFDRSVGQCNQAHLVYCPGDPGITTAPPEWTTPPEWEFTTPPPEWTTPPPWEPPTTPPPSVEYPRCVPNGQIHHAHPTDCNRFFFCVNEILIPRQCPTELYWNQLKNVCDLPESANCITGGGGGGTTTTDPPLWPPPPDPPGQDPPEDDDSEEDVPDNGWTEPSLLPPVPK